MVEQISSNGIDNSTNVAGSKVANQLPQSSESGPKVARNNKSSRNVSGPKVADGNNNSVSSRKVAHGVNKVGQKVTESKSSNVVELTKTPQPILLLQIVQIDLAKLLNMISHPLWC